jgi:hypothetical protein
MCEDGSVRSSAASAGLLSPLRGAAVAAMIGIILGVSGESREARADQPRSLLLGPPARAPAPRPVDPRLPTGGVRVDQPRPSGASTPACGFRAPVCVHAAPSVEPARALQTLQSLERAYERLVWALDLPAPRDDLGRGGSDALDLYLVDGHRDGELGVYNDVAAGQGWDATSSFCVLDAVSTSSFERAAALCVGEAIGRRLDAAETPHTLRGYATHLWWLSGAPTTSDWDALDRIQLMPERSIGGRELERTSEGAALFFEYLDATWGFGAPGWLASSLVALSAGKTAAPAFRWNNEPDTWDIVRESVGGLPRFASLMSDFSVRRAFLGERDDGTHFPGLGWAGWFGSPRFDWTLGWSSLPRRVLLSRPIAPTGAAYLWVDLDGVALGSVLGFQAECEGPAPFVWSLVRVGRDGRELGRLEVPFQEAVRRVEQRVTNLETAAGVIVVATNLGGISTAFPFDPDIYPYEPHNCSVYLVRL